MRQWIKNNSKLKHILTVSGFCLLFSLPAAGEELFMEPVIQKVPLDDLLTVIYEENTYYIGILDLARVLRIKLDTANGLKGSFTGTPFTINLQDLPVDQYKIIAGQTYFSLPFYEKLLNINMTADKFDMQLAVSADRNLPITTARLLEGRQQNFTLSPQMDTFQNYSFDHQKWRAPVIDLSLTKGIQVTDYNSNSQRYSNQTSYQADIGMLAAGFDMYASIFGDRKINEYGPRARMTVGRTFLEEPQNPINLTTFEAGDVTGYNGTLFNNSASGRGVAASSFKDLVLSADKTIDINGPLSEGWQVELYQNNQLIGFRQSGSGGRYQFANVPVSYGLNTFRLVFYGPYGEIQTEERQYYSGTSPVKTGEFGYVLNAYQKDRYLFEHNEPFVPDSDRVTSDFTGYYGLNDTTSLISGFSQSPNEKTNEMRTYGMVGAQKVFSAVSLQYNILYGFDNSAIGHHADAQGTLPIGDIFTRYDYYGKLQTPISYYNDQYLKDLGEVRLTGYVAPIGVPYYVSYRRGSYQESGNDFQEVHTRLSPSFLNHYYVSLENIWYKDPTERYDDAVLMLQAQFDKLGISSQIRYRVEPSGYLSALTQQVDYRWDKYTYIQANWDHDCRSNYTTDHDLDTFSIGAGRLFDFGGLNLTFSLDTDRNAAVSLTYNISLGKIPDQSRVFTNAQNKMSKRASIHTRVIDENNNPIPDAKVNVSGLQNPIQTDEYGEFVVSDMEPYAKTILTLDSNSITDLSLVPENDTQKLVLRPGTVRPVEFKLAHLGGVEGWIQSSDPQNYRLQLINSKNEIIETKIPEADGSFIFDSIPFGKYTIRVCTLSDQVITQSNVQIDEAFESLAHPITLSD